MKLVYYPDLAG